MNNYTVIATLRVDDTEFINEGDDVVLEMDNGDTITVEVNEINQRDMRVMFYGEELSILYSSIKNIEKRG